MHAKKAWFFILVVSISMILTTPSIRADGVETFVAKKGEALKLKDGLSIKYLKSLPRSALFEDENGRKHHFKIGGKTVFRGMGFIVKKVTPEEVLLEVYETDESAPEIEPPKF